MQDGFDIWKNRLEDADAEALNDGFNADATWRGLQHRLQQPAKRKTWIYAAAVLAGLLLGGTLMQLFNSNDKEQVVVKKVIIQQVPSNAAAPNATPASPVKNDMQPVQNIASVKQVRIKAMPQHVAQPIPQVQSQPEPLNEPELVASKGPLGILVHETIEAAPVKVVHLLDIHNEDKATMVRTKQSVGARSNVVSAFKELHQPEVQSNSGPSSILSGIFK